MRDLWIAPNKGAKAETKKGRSFHALEVATVYADALWDKGKAGKVRRPIWAQFVGSQVELRAFAANLRLGREAVTLRHGRGSSDSAIEFLKSVQYQWTWQHFLEGSLLTVCLPELVRLDPGMVDPAGLRFVLLPEQQYIQAQVLPDDALARVAAHLPRVFPSIKPEHLAFDHARLVTALLFVAYLDRRTRAPLLTDPVFAAQLLIACLDAKLASTPRSSHYRLEWGEASFGFEATGLTDAGISAPLAVRADHAEFETLLADQVARYFARQK